MVTLIRIQAAEYKDQYGIRHECYDIIETVDVEPTGNYYTYDYYGDIIQNAIYADDRDDARFWVRMVPTDFGCPATWRRHHCDQADITDDDPRDQIWLKAREGGPYEWGRKPVLDLKSVS